MRMSTGARVALIVLAVVVGIAAFGAYSLEGEYGGQSAIEGLAKGYLSESVVEVRELDWGLGPEASNDYEMTLDGSGAAAVALVDGNGRVLFTGTQDKAISWLDTQGPQKFVGTNQAADAYLADLRDGAESYTTSIILGIVAVGLLLIAVMPTKKEQQKGVIGSAAPTT